MPDIRKTKEVEADPETDVERISTGVPGLDHILEGGFPHPSTVLLTGESGTGKTILGLQYLYNGVKQYDEPGIYLTIQGYDTDLTWYCSRFNLDIGELQEERKAVITTYEIAEYEEFHARSVAREIEKRLSRLIESVNAKRVVIDNITPFGYFSSSKADYRKLLHRLSSSLKKEGCSTLFISEKPDREKLTPFQVEPYVVDGVIKLGKDEQGKKRKRRLKINKMVATRTPLGPTPFTITEDGFKLLTSYYE